MKNPTFKLLALLGAFSVTACSTVVPPKAADCACPAAQAPATTSPGSTAPPTTTPALPTAKPQEPAPAPALVSSPLRELPNWNNFDHAMWLQGFVKQCSEASGNALGKLKATPDGLLKACQTALRHNAATQNPTQARNYVEANFEAWQLQKEDGGKEGLLTGYFEPLLRGSRQKSSSYIAPLWPVPKDLITVELAGLFPELEGKRVRGRVVGNKLLPYFDRKTWEATGGQKETPLVWIDNKLDAFLLQVQGSGRVQLPNGEMVRLSYADQNGHPYKAIGKVLVQRGELTSAQATIPGISAWAEKNPQRLDELLNENPSVVFFTENKKLNANEGPVGALGIPLTGELSLAVDRKRIPYGSLMWVESSNPVSGQPIQKGMLAQDTGGAITGRVRADFYWGTGKEAGQLAGLMRQPLKMWLIWPKGVELPKVQ